MCSCTTQAFCDSWRSLPRPWASTLKRALRFLESSRNSIGWRAPLSRRRRSWSTRAMPKPLTSAAGYAGKARRTFAAAVRRSRAEIVPPAFQFLWQKPRFLVAYGGRASAKSWSIARVLLSLANEQPLRILVSREIMSSIKESAYRLLVDQIQLLGLSDYVIRADSIGHRNGSEF